MFSSRDKAVFYEDNIPSEFTLSVLGTTYTYYIATSYSYKYMLLGTTAARESASFGEQISG